MYNISKGTIVRAIMFVIVLINLFLKAIGRPIIEVDEGSLGCFIEYAFSAAVLIYTFWKNNSFSKAAIILDKILKKIKNGETDISVFETQIEEDETITIDTEVAEDVEGF